MAFSAMTWYNSLKFGAAAPLHISERRDPVGAEQEKYQAHSAAHSLRHPSVLGAEQPVRSGRAAAQHLVPVFPAAHRRGHRLCDEPAAHGHRAAVGQGAEKGAGAVAGEAEAPHLPDPRIPAVFGHYLCHYLHSYSPFPLSLLRIVLRFNWVIVAFLSQSLQICYVVYYIGFIYYCQLVKSNNPHRI